MSILQPSDGRETTVTEIESHLKLGARYQAALRFFAAVAASDTPAYSSSWRFRPSPHRTTRWPTWLLAIGDHVAEVRFLDPSTAWFNQSEQDQHCGDRSDDGGNGDDPVGDATRATRVAFADGRGGPR